MFNMDLFRDANLKIRESFLLCNTVIQRVRQLHEGADPLVENENMSLVDIALKEIALGKIETRQEDITTEQDLFGQAE